MQSYPLEAPARLAPGAKGPPEGPRETQVLSSPELRLAWDNLQGAKERLITAYAWRMRDKTAESVAAHVAALRAERAAETAYSDLYQKTHTDGGDRHG